MPLQAVYRSLILGPPPPLFVIETQQSRCQPPQVFAETKQVGDESWFSSRKHYLPG